jgi:thymidylate synthase (FAD)
MAETQLTVRLIAHTRLADDFAREINAAEYGASDTQMVALSAIRTCYSYLKPTEIIKKEGEKYFLREATDGEGGTDADRLVRHIMRSKHTSTVEHITYTFAVEGLSRSALAQLTRHRVGFSYSVQSQRYVKFGSSDRSGGASFMIPESVRNNREARRLYDVAMQDAQYYYDQLRELGIPAEDARQVFPNGVTCNLVMTANLRALLDFYGKRRHGRGAQKEIADLAELLRTAVTKVDPWTAPFFEEA